jgi:hypothetical protein
LLPPPALLRAPPDACCLPTTNTTPRHHQQTKDTLTIKASSFGSKCELSGALLERVAKCGVMDNILSFAAFKNQKALGKSDGAKRSRLTGACAVWRVAPVGVRCAAAAQRSASCLC